MPVRSGTGALVTSIQADMEELVNLTGGDEVATDQVLYNLNYRGIEFDLLPWCQRGGLPVMAYSPIEQGRILRHPALIAVAACHPGVTPAQVALAWVLRQDGICAIPGQVSRRMCARTG